jgi:hypothetical protein
MFLTIRAHLIGSGQTWHCPIDYTPVGTDISRQDKLEGHIPAPAPYETDALRKGASRFVAIATSSNVIDREEIVRPEIREFLMKDRRLEKSAIGRVRRLVL